MCTIRINHIFLCSSHSNLTNPSGWDYSWNSPLIKKKMSAWICVIREIRVLNKYTPNGLYKSKITKKMTDSNNLFIQPWSRHWITRLPHGFSMPIILTKTKRDFRKIQSNFRKRIWGFVFPISISVKRLSLWGRCETWNKHHSPTTKSRFKHLN